MIPRILITPGEPAGIGPDVLLQAIQEPQAAELIAVCDPELLSRRANELNLPVDLIPFDAAAPPTLSPPHTLKIISVPLNAPVHAGKLTRENAGYVLRCLEIATDYCLQTKTAALVTGPVHKGVINDANFNFSGHTEFLAQRCNTPQSVMLFVTPEIKVALLTTHLPLSQVPKAVTAEKLQQVLRILHLELIKKFGLSDPTIMVCGLNPHAGEQGHLGHEETDIIEPALEQLRREKMQLIGPLPADTVFTKRQLQRADAILAMYHDQALPVVKYSGFEQAVNVTLGLPIIRTSVDHGTALDLAGTGQADAGSLKSAIALAIDLLNL
jgi:4-hydroxythreonine-4-phosphate dehydrogenase